MDGSVGGWVGWVSGSIDGWVGRVSGLIGGWVGCASGLRVGWVGWVSGLIGGWAGRTPNSLTVEVVVIAEAGQERSEDWLVQIVACLCPFVCRQNTQQLYDFQKYKATGNYRQAAVPPSNKGTALILSTVKTIHTQQKQVASIPGLPTDGTGCTLCLKVVFVIVGKSFCDKNMDF